MALIEGKGLSISFKFEGKNVSRSVFVLAPLTSFKLIFRAVPMPASGENRVLEICGGNFFLGLFCFNERTDAVMGVIAKHFKKDREVLQSRIFGISAHSFSSEGSGVAERSIAKFLVANAEPKWSEENTTTAASSHPREGALDKFVRRDEKNAAIDWDYVKEETKSDQKNDQSLLDSFVLQSSVDWSCADVEQVRDVKSAAIDWSYDVGTSEKKAKKAKSTDEQSVAELLKQVQERNEQCPVCMVFVSKASLAKHASSHFEEEEEEENDEKVVEKEDKKTVQKKKQKKRRTASSSSSIEKFFKKE